MSKKGIEEDAFASLAEALCKFYEIILDLTGSEALAHDLTAKLMATDAWHYAVQGSAVETLVGALTSEGAGGGNPVPWMEDASGDV